MKIALAQIDPIVGAFTSNCEKISKAYQQACRDQARVLLTPELSLCGYPTHDLIERSEFFEQSQRALAHLAQLTVGQTCALVVGSVGKNPKDTGKPAVNRVTLFENGKEVFEQWKSLLPTYDVFDEARYFEPAHEIKLWNCDGIKVAIAICEDLWAEDPKLERSIYAKNPIEVYKKLGAELLISISASPYEWKKSERREQIHCDIAKKLGIPLVYINQVGANDEILFDGASFCSTAQGKLAGRLPFFETGYACVDPIQGDFGSGLSSIEPSDIEILSRGLVVGIRDYFHRTGFDSALIGLSGGIDSAVVATLAARALGPGKVIGVAMPSQHSSSHSLEDAQILAKNLGIHFDIKPIKFINSTFSRELAEGRGVLAPIALENLQSRLRGIILMTLSNHLGALVLTTGNKSEIAMGYCTLYGDMCGALAPLGDLFKTKVYELARYLNLAWGDPIPVRSIDKPPSAELRPHQTDQDSLPPYELLDALLEDYLEKQASVVDLEKTYAERLANSTGSVRGAMGVRDILRTVERNEHKRRQSAPALKISAKAFGMGRRVPLAKVWDL